MKNNHNTPASVDKYHLLEATACRAADSAVMGRRGFLTGALALGLAGALSACTGNGNAAGSATGSAAAAGSSSATASKTTVRVASLKGPILRNDLPGDRTPPPHF